MLNDLTGTILKYKNSYWKITGPAIKLYYCDSYSYPVVKCSKLGKEYRDTNGFDSIWVNSAILHGEMRGLNLVSTGSTIGTKANIDAGIDSAKRLNRINHLRNKIDVYQKELERLLGQA